MKNGNKVQKRQKTVPLCAIFYTNNCYFVNQWKCLWRVFLGFGLNISEKEKKIKQTKMKFYQETKTNESLTDST